MTRACRRARAGRAFLLAALVPSMAYAQARPAAELAGLSLEALANMSVTSVSRRAEPLAGAATAIFVISPDDIRRSGATTLAEALRLAPNLAVARLDARTYAVSARGFNNAIANKLLVLVDGRTVYSPVFSGVFWDQQDVMLEDVARIEVISGPGAAQWGANAVNGVINVITRPSGATQGLFATAHGGTSTHGAGLRFGGRIGGATYRVHAKAADFDGTDREDGMAAGGGWRRAQAGLRVDWANASGAWMVLADAYQGKVDTTPLGRPSFSGASVLARWSRRLRDDSELRVRAYADQAERDDLIAFRDHMRLYDIDAQYGAKRGAHQFSLGAGYRWAEDRAERTPLIAFIPERRVLRWASVFAQDTVRIAAGLHATLGVKLESNVYTGWEVLPSARLAWMPAEGQLVWGALSRAVRAPARLDREFFFPGTPPYLINGGPDFRSEIAHVVEVGYRASPTPNSTISASVFHNEYDRLRSGQAAPAMVSNMIEGSATGFEAWGSYQATPRWRLAAGLATLRSRLHLKPGSTDPSGPRELGNDPGHQWMLRSSFNPSPAIDLDVWVRRTGALPDPSVPAYTAVELRGAWRAAPGLEVSLTVRNATDPGHREFNAAANASEFGREAIVAVAWRFP